MKRFVLMLFPVLLVFLSCKKMDSAIPTNYQTDAQSNVIGRVVNNVTTVIQTPTVTVDTVPPADAVSVKKYNATGLGILDDSDALQNAINAENDLVLPAGIYIISKTLNMRAGVKIYGAKGAIIKAGLGMKGTLLNEGWFFLLQNDDNCAFLNITFQSARAFKSSDWYNSCIFVQNSANTNISYNNFNFSLAYGTKGIDAVWVSGVQSTNTIIKGNKLSSVGIEYAEAGASGTTVDGNTIDHAPSDGLSAHGNTSTFCSQNILTNNVITNSGMMGIEDWGNVDGTIIKNNTVTGCGKDPAQKKDGMGISAVGVNTYVVGNTVTDAQAYYIECGRNNTVSGNVINDTQGTAIGIIANYTAADTSNGRRQPIGQTITNNTITGCSDAIWVYGNFLTNDINISSNTITNPFSIGISIDNQSTAFNITIANNNISFTAPNNGSLRTAAETYTDAGHRTSGQIVTFNNNTVTYTSGAANGNGLEKGFIIASDNAVANGNKVYGNNITPGGSAVCGICGDGDPARNVTLTSNTVQGATVNLSDFSYNVSADNAF